MLISHLVRQFPIHHLNADAALLHVVHLILHLLLHHEVALHGDAALGELFHQLFYFHCRFGFSVILI